MESIWNGIEMDNFWEKRSVGYVVLMEREWNGNGMEFFLTNQVEISCDEIRWKCDKVHMIMLFKCEWSRQNKLTKQMKILI